MTRPQPDKLSFCIEYGCSPAPLTDQAASLTESVHLLGTTVGLYTHSIIKYRNVRKYDFVINHKKVFKKNRIIKYIVIIKNYTYKAPQLVKNN